jgi:hypothetical protein
MESTNSYKNGIPQFDGQKYAFWSIRMRTYIQKHAFQVWQSIVDGYTTPTVPPTNDKAIKLSENNSKATNALLSGLSDMVFTKVAHCKSTEEIWDKLKNIYEGDTKVKAAKIQTYRGQFEQLKMKEDEDIIAYFLRVDETMNAIIGLGEEIEESVIVQKILRSLPMRFMLELLHTHLGFIFPKVCTCLLVIISHYLVSYILGENIPPGEYSLSVGTSV